MKQMTGALLIPHASEEYAGECRYHAFSKIKYPLSVRYIIYISALHSINDTDTDLDTDLDIGLDID